MEDFFHSLLDITSQFPCFLIVHCKGVTVKTQVSLTIRDQIKYKKIQAESNILTWNPTFI